jgi:hypothetical protein
MTGMPRQNRAPAEAQVRRWGRCFVVGLCVGAAVAAAAMVGLRPAVQDGAIPADQAAALQERVEQSYAQLQALRGQLVTADAELAIERAARRALEDNLSALQAQAGQLRDRLAFYDQLLPAGPAGTVSIRAVEMTRVPAGLRYRVLLMRSAHTGLPQFSGALQFLATGTLAGKDVRIPLAALQAAPDAQPAIPVDTPSDGGISGTITAAGGRQATAPGRSASLGAAPVAGAPGQPGADGAGDGLASPEPAGAVSGHDAALPTPAQAGLAGAVASAPGSSNDQGGAMQAAVVTPVPPGPILVPVQVDQYLSTEGILDLPKGFSPSTVSVSVVQDGAVMATQQAAVSF